jgi:RimJ/RimL family protein N-acetyltransferase
MRFVKEIDSKEIAKIIANWKYPKPYDIYNMNGEEDAINEILTEDYYSYIYKNNIIGYFCFGKSARVPTDKAEIYKNDEYLDIGIGMNPKLCGEGRGYDFFGKALKAAYEIYEKKKYRLTVAEFNKRAIKVYQKHGFRKENEFVRENDNNNVKFITMTYK